MKTDSGRLENSSIFSSRESLLKANSDLICQLQIRLKAKRFRPQEGDSLKLAYMRVFIQALQAQAAILKDVDIDRLQADVEELKQAIKTQSQDGRCVP